MNKRYQRFLSPLEAPQLLLKFISASSEAKQTGFLLPSQKAPLTRQKSYCRLAMLLA